MNKKEFFEELNEYLVGVSNKDREELLQDYEEHFKVGKKKKRSERDIIKSLGEPKQIAREIRAELYSSEKTELKSEAIETWVAAKQFSRHLFNEAKDKISDAIHSDGGKKRDDKTAKVILIGLIVLVVLLIFNGSFLKIILLGTLGYFIFRYFQEHPSSGKSHSKIKAKNKKITKRNISPLGVVASIAFNLLFFVWFWISVLSIIFSIFIVSFAIIISAGALIALAVFALITHNNPVIKDILFAGLFAGFGTLILGSLAIDLSGWLVKMFFRLTKKYIELNNWVIRK
jgi:uncharacterized membrane protein